MSTTKSFMVLLLVIAFPLAELHAASVFLKDGSIIEGKVLNKTGTSVRIRKDGSGVITVKRKKIKRIVSDDRYKKRMRLYLVGGSKADVYIVAENRYALIVRDRLYDADEFSISKRRIVRKMEIVEKKEEDSAGSEGETLLIGQARTWDTVNFGVGATYSVLPGLFGRNFRDGIGGSVRIFNSPNRSLFWGVSMEGTVLRTQEHTQYTSYGNVLCNASALMGYTFPLIRHRFSVSLYGGAGYNFLMLGHYGDPDITGQASEMDSSSIFEPDYHHLLSVTTGIQLPLRFFRRTNIMPFVEHHWFPGTRGYLGLVQMGVSINW